ncbi:MAG: AAA family ATPase [Acidobacteriota bacterium]
MNDAMPEWADRMGHLYRSGSASQFLLYGNVHDLVPTPPAGTGGRFVSLRRFLTEVMFEPFDVVIHYDRGRGIRVRKGGDHFHQFLKMYDSFRGTSWAALPDTGEGKVETLDLANQLPRDARQALEVLDRFLRGSQRLTEIDEEGRRVPAPLRVAVVIDYAHFVAPQGDPLHLSGERSQILIRLLDWASDPALTEGLVATVLITENLAQIHRSLAENPYAAKLSIELPTADEIRTFVLTETDGVDFDQASDVSREALAGRLVGLSRVNVRALLRRALASGNGAESDRITQEYLTDVKKELIEKEAFGRITFLESDRTLDDVAGHEEAKAWLRQDAELLKRGRLRAIPMGYLLCGRIGTGKTFLVHCWAGEVGVPVVEIKNFREKWVGATEANLERVFGILRALGQVIVFVDEADQATGKRGGGDGDSGLSGRVYGMLAREMSKTENRGKIIWVFATSRPDLVEVDLKRQGRLDVHIPLFPPGTPESRRDLFRAMARKVGLGIDPDDLPDPPDNEQIGGNEMEGILVRALRLYETQPEDEDRKALPEVIREVLKDVRPSAHVERLQLMDLLAVKECTDTRFLPPRFAKLSLGEVNRRIDDLRMQVRE